MRRQSTVVPEELTETSDIRVISLSIGQLEYEEAMRRILPICVIFAIIVPLFLIRPIDVDVQVVAIRIRPSILIENPTNDTTVKGRIKLTASFDTAFALSKVEYRIDDGAWVKISTKDRIASVEWDSSSVSNGKHKIEFRVTDSIEQSATSSVTVIVDNPPAIVGEMPYGTVGVVAIGTLATAIAIALLLRRGSISKTGSGAKPSSKFCIECGTMISEGGTYCPSCGKKTE